VYCVCVHVFLYTHTHTHTHTRNTHTLTRTYTYTHTQMLCDGINRNQLAIFLASNIMTGATNLVLPTLTATWQEGFVTTTTSTTKLNL